jgi:hypothetical protein
MEIRVARTCFAVASFSLLLGGSGCGSSPSSGPRPIDPTAFGAQFKIADNEIQGWTLNSAADSFWAGTDLVGGPGIDGAAATYTDRGFRQGMFQYLSGPDSQTCTIEALDFGTADAATAMYAYAQANFVSHSVAIPNYGSSTAIGGAAISGVTAYAHFGATYLEVGLSGLGDQTASCTQCPLAQTFLDEFKKKSN